jgi:raffinose/stachyose/melibiose transport system substrate-binding protein
MLPETINLEVGKMKRIVSVLTAVMLFTGIFTACSGEKKAEAGEKIVLECIQWKSEATDAYDAWVAAFQKKYPQVTVEFFGANSYQQTLQGRLAAKDAPDLIAVLGGNTGFNVARGGHLMDLSDSPILARIRDDVIESQRYGGKIYSIPIDMAAHGVIYNRKVFADLGLSVPSTWDEFKGVCQKLKDGGIVPMVITGKDSWTLGIVGTTLASFVYGKNPNFDLDVIEGRDSFTNDSWLKVMADYDTIIKNYANEDIVSMDYTLGNQMVANGEAAMLIQGIWAVSAIEQFNPDVELGIFQIPNAPNAGEACLILGTDFTIGISATTEYPEECMAFLDFISSDEGVRIWVEKCKTFSAAKNADMEFNRIARDINAILAAGIKTYPLPNHMWFMENVWIDWGNSIQEYNTGAITARESLSVLERSLRDAYAIGR